MNNRNDIDAVRTRVETALAIVSEAFSKPLYLYSDELTSRFQDVYGLTLKPSVPPDQFIRLIGLGDTFGAFLSRKANQETEARQRADPSWHIGRRVVFGGDVRRHRSVLEILSNTAFQQDVIGLEKWFWYITEEFIKVDIPSLLVPPEGQAEAPLQGAILDRYLASESERESLGVYLQRCLVLKHEQARRRMEGGGRVSFHGQATHWPEGEDAQSAFLKELHAERVLLETETRAFFGLPEDWSGDLVEACPMLASVAHPIIPAILDGLEDESFQVYKALHGGGVGRQTAINEALQVGLAVIDDSAETFLDLIEPDDLRANYFLPFIRIMANSIASEQSHPRVLGILQRSMVATSESWAAMKNSERVLYVANIVGWISLVASLGALKLVIRGVIAVGSRVTLALLALDAMEVFSTSLGYTIQMMEESRHDSLNQLHVVHGVHKAFPEGEAGWLFMRYIMITIASFALTGAITRAIERKLLLKRALTDAKDIQTKLRKAGSQVTKMYEDGDDVENLLDLSEDQLEMIEAGCEPEIPYFRYQMDVRAGDPVFSEEKDELVAMLIDDVMDLVECQFWDEMKDSELEDWYTWSTLADR